MKRKEGQVGDMEMGERLDRVNKRQRRFEVLVFYLTISMLYNFIPLLYCVDIRSSHKKQMMNL